MYIYIESQNDDLTDAHYLKSGELKKNNNDGDTVETSIKQLN